MDGAVDTNAIDCLWATELSDTLSEAMGPDLKILTNQQECVLVSESSAIASPLYINTFSSAVNHCC